MISTLAVLVAALYLVLYAVDKFRKLSTLAHLAGPGYPLPVLGHVAHMFGPRDGLMKRGMAVWYRYGPGPVKFWIGETPMVTITRPEDVEPLLTSTREVDKHDTFYRPVQTFFGNGLISLSGKAWAVHRKALTPAFHFRVLDRYAGIFTRRAATFASQLRAEVPAGQSFNVQSKFGTFVIGSIMETAFGIDPASGETQRTEQLQQLVRASEDAFYVVAKRVLQPWLLIDAVFNLSPLGRLSRRHEDIICRMTERVLEVKKAQLRRRAEAAAARGGVCDQDGEEDGRDQDDDSVRDKYTFLDMALGDKAHALSDKEIIEEVRTLIAVQQTTASTLSFIMVMLALYPEVQERARAEVREVDAVKGLHPLERLKRLKYVERVIKETLRLFPITTLFSRKLKEPLQLPDKKTVPAGMMVTVFMYLVHRDPRHWPDPEHFEPDRFLPDNCTGRHPYAYAPFSAGPRNCIGQRYAMLQMAAVVAALLARVRVLPGDGCETRAGLRVNTDVFLTIEGGFNVRLEPLEPLA